MTPPRRARRRIAGLVIPKEDYYQCAVCMRQMCADSTLNVVTKNLAVAFSTTLSETLKTTKEHITTRMFKRVRIHTLPPLPRPDMSSLCCRSVVDLLGCVSCSTSDGGVDDGGKKRKPFVDQTSLITFVSRLFGRIDALYLKSVHTLPKSPSSLNTFFDPEAIFLLDLVGVAVQHLTMAKFYGFNPYKQLIRLFGRLFEHKASITRLYNRPYQPPPPPALSWRKTTSNAPARSVHCVLFYKVIRSL